MSWERTVEPRCPECGGPCEYNGNYYCVADDEGCGWALEDLYDPDVAATPEAWRWFRDAYVSLLRRDGVEPERGIVAEASVQGFTEFWEREPTADEVAKLWEFVQSS